MVISSVDGHHRPYRQFDDLIGARNSHGFLPIFGGVTMVNNPVTKGSQMFIGLCL